MGLIRAVLAKQEFSERALALTEAAIDLNQSFYSTWQHRRQCLRFLKCDLSKELARVAEWGGKNPKNFQLWQHRRALSSDIGRAAAMPELVYTSAVIAEDAKNYHAWSHRRWVLQSLCLPAISAHEGHTAESAHEGTLPPWETLRGLELDWVDVLLDADARNNSAWTHRWFVQDLSLSEPPTLPAGAMEAHSALAWMGEEVVVAELEWAASWLHKSGVWANESAYNHIRAAARAARSRFRAEQGQATPPSADSAFSVDRALAPATALVAELQRRLRATEAGAGDDEAAAAGTGEPFEPFVASFVSAFVAEWLEDEAMQKQDAPGVAQAVEAMLVASRLDTARAALWSKRAALLSSDC
jgi:hypothetical protein